MIGPDDSRLIARAIQDAHITPNQRAELVAVMKTADTLDEMPQWVIDIIDAYQGMESKGIRRVRDPRYWGKPYGTPITPGMKPEGEDPWSGWPWDARKGEGPRLGDIPPERDIDGNWIVYHGTSRENAQKIMEERRLLPDDLGVVGIGPTPAAVRGYGIRKDGPDSVVLKIRLDGERIQNAQVQHEIGGSGTNQYLFTKPHGTTDEWNGITARDIVSISVEPDPDTEVFAKGYHVSLDGQDPTKSDWVHFGDDVTAGDRLMQMQRGTNEYGEPRKWTPEEQAVIDHIVLHDKPLTPAWFEVELLDRPMNDPELPLPDYAANALTSDRMTFVTPEEAKKRGWDGDPRDITQGEPSGMVAMPMTQEEWLARMQEFLDAHDPKRIPHWWFPEYEEALALHDVWAKVVANDYKVGPVYYRNRGEKSHNPSVAAPASSVRVTRVPAPVEHERQWDKDIIWDTPIMPTDYRGGEVAADRDRDSLRVHDGTFDAFYIKPNEPLPESSPAPDVTPPTSRFQRSMTDGPEVEDGIIRDLDHLAINQSDGTHMKRYIQTRLASRFKAKMKEDPVFAANVNEWIDTRVPESSVVKNFFIDYISYSSGAMWRERGARYESERYASIKSLLSPDGQDILDRTMAESVGAYELPDALKRDLPEQDYSTLVRFMLLTEAWRNDPEIVIREWDKWKTAPMPNDDLRLMIATSGIIHEWANTSMDSSAPSIAVQFAARDLFGVDTFDSARPNADIEHSGALQEYEQFGPIYRETVRIIYDDTQEFLAANGIEGMTLYRGMKIPINTRGRTDTPEGFSYELSSVGWMPSLDEYEAHVQRKFDEHFDRLWDEWQKRHPEDTNREAFRDAYDQQIEMLKRAGMEVLTLEWYDDLVSEEFANGATLDLQPLSAFSFDYNSARKFAGDDRYSTSEVDLIMSTYVPADRIFSTSFTGFGCTHEREVIVIGDSNVETYVTVLRGGAAAQPYQVHISINDMEAWMKKHGVTT